MDNTEQRLIKAVDLLNAMLEAQPEVRRFLDSGIKANEALDSIEGLFCRETTGGVYLTFTGVISAIAGAFGGAEGLTIASVWDDERTCLVGFVVRKLGNSSVGSQSDTIYKPQAVIDHWESKGAAIDE